jgi:rubrerythrin
MTPRKPSPRPPARPAESHPVHELLYQALECELGGVEVYRAALQCVQNADLREEWEKYLAQTQEHVRSLQAVFRELGLDPDLDTPGRQVVRHIGKSLVQAMHMALGADDARAAQLVAAECVTLAETKDHLDWSLLGELLLQVGDRSPARLVQAHKEVESQEDEHLYHSQGWARELWLEFLGLQAVVPPPEEQLDVESAGEAAAAKKQRDRFVEKEA